MIQARYAKNRIRLKTGESQRKNGTFSYSWKDRTGKRRYVYAKTIQELRQKEEEIARDLFDGIVHSRADLTINSYYEIWKKIKTGVRASYFASCTRTYEYYIEPTLGKTMLKNVTYSMVVMFLENLAKSRNLRYGTLRNIVLVLSMVFDLAVRDDVIRHNPCKGCLKELKREYGKITKLVRSLTIEEQRVFETFLSESKQFHRWSPVFTVMMWTGMRAGEVLGLRWDDVDFENNEINVNHIFVDYSLGKGKEHVYTINPPKTRNSYRSIPMLPKVRAALLEEKENHELLGIKCISNINGYTDFVFLNSLGKIMTGKDLNQALNRIRDAINKEIIGGKDYHINWFPHVHNHMLRHTFATRMREAGADMKATSDIMGHEGILITLKTYTDASHDFKTREITVLDDYYKNVQ